jgi:hypothetical protein
MTTNYEQSQNSAPTSSQKIATSVPVREQKALEESKKATYVDKTERIKALSQFIKSVTPYLWAIVIVVLLISRGLIANSSSINIPKSTIIEPQGTIVIDKKVVKWSQVDQSMINTIKNADNTAQSLPEARLDDWVHELMTRIDW